MGHETMVNEAAVRRVFTDVVNGGRLELIDEYYASDVVDHDPLPGAPPGRPGIQYTLRGLREMYPDVQVTISQLVCHRDIVMVRNTWRGTCAKGLLGLSRGQGQVVEFQGIVVFRLVGGLVAERWASIDVDGMLQQLGVTADGALASDLCGDWDPDADTSTLRALGRLLTRARNNSGNALPA